MQMNQCSPHSAAAFVAQVRPVLDGSLTPSGQTLLMLSASISSLNLAKAILSCRPNVRARDRNGRTALHYAAAVGSADIFELLVAAGSDPLEQTIGGETALSKACLFAQSSVIEWYLNNCLQAFELPDWLGKKPLELLRNSGEELYHEVREVYEELMRQ
jgi:ankyrin repeat protein